MTSRSLLILLILGVLAKSSWCTMGPMLGNLTYILNMNMSNGLGDNPALGFLANNLARDQRLNPSMLQNLNISAIVQLYDQLGPEYLMNNCDKADGYYKLLMSFKNTSFESFLTLDRIRPLLACRKDCFVYPLFRANLTNEFNTAMFLARNLPPKVAKMCSSLLRKMVGLQRNSSSSNMSEESMGPMMINFIKSNPSINIGAVFTPVSIRRLPRQDAMSLIENLSAQTELTPEITKELGKFVQKTASLAGYMKIASGIPLDILDGASLSDLLSCLTDCDLRNFDKTRTARLVRSILQKSATAQTLLALTRTNNPDVLNSIPNDLLSTINLSAMNPSDLPMRAKNILANNVLRATPLTNLQDDTVIQRILPALPVSKIANLSGMDMVMTYSRLLAANRASATNLLSSTQRSMMLDNLLRFSMSMNQNASGPAYMNQNASGPAFMNQNASGPAYMNQNASRPAYMDQNASGPANMTKEDDNALAELYIEANETIISYMAKQKDGFANFISILARIPEAKCINYRPRSRGLLARYAISTLAQNPSSPTESDLDMLGPCLASALPVSILSSVAPAVLMNRIFYFSGAKFQPDAQTAQAFSSKLSQISQLSMVKNYPGAFFSDLGDSIVFFPNIGSIDKEILAMYGPQWLQSAKETRNPSNDRVQDYRLGVPDSASINTFFMGAQSAIVNSIKNSAMGQSNRVSSRKKRATTSGPQFTCDDCSEGKICLEMYSDMVCQFSINDLATLSNNDMTQCLSVLGSSTDCTAKNLTDISNLVLNRLYNNSAAGVSDTNIQDLNQLVQGMAPEQISRLNIQSSQTVSVIGQLSQMTSTQLQSIMTPLRQFVGSNFDSSSLITMGNMACGLNDTDVQKISESDLTASLPILGEMENTAGNCSGAYPLYNRTRQILGISSILTPDVLTMIGSIAGGMPPADARNLSQDATTAILPGAFNYMQVGSVATIAANNLNVLTSEQLSTITNSDVYTSLPTSVQTSLNSEIDSTGSTSTTTSTKSGSGAQRVSWFTMLSLVLSTLVAMSFSFSTN